MWIASNRNTIICKSKVPKLVCHVAYVVGKIVWVLPFLFQNMKVQQENYIFSFICAIRWHAEFFIHSTERILHKHRHDKQICCTLHKLLKSIRPTMMCLVGIEYLLYHWQYLICAASSVFFLHDNKGWYCVTPVEHTHFPFREKLFSLGLLWIICGQYFPSLQTNKIYGLERWFYICKIERLSWWYCFRSTPNSGHFTHWDSNVADRVCLWQLYLQPVSKETP